MRSEQKAINIARCTGISITYMVPITCTAAFEIPAICMIHE